MKNQGNKLFYTMCLTGIKAQLTLVRKLSVIEVEQWHLISTLLLLAMQFHLLCDTVKDRGQGLRKEKDFD